MLNIDAFLYLWDVIEHFSELHNNLFCTIFSSVSAIIT